MAYQQALAICPTHAVAYNNLASLLAEERRQSLRCEHLLTGGPDAMLNEIEEMSSDIQHLQLDLAEAQEKLRKAHLREIQTKRLLDENEGEIEIAQNAIAAAQPKLVDIEANIHATMVALQTELNASKESLQMLQLHYAPEITAMRAQIDVLNSTEVYFSGRKLL